MTENKTDPESKPRLALHWQILIGLVLAVVMGLLVPQDAALLGVRLSAVLDFFGTLFLRGLKMVVVPLVFASIVASVAALGGTEGLGRLGLRTGLFYALTTTCAVVIGLVFVNAIRPGILGGVPASKALGLTADATAALSKVEGRSAKDLVEVFLRLVPENPIADAAKGDMLGLIFFALVFGFFTTRVPAPLGPQITDFFKGVTEVMLRITDWVLQAAPVGVFALVGKVVLETGLGAVKPLLAFFLTVVGALATHAFVLIPLLLFLLGRVNPLRHYKAMAPALLMAFSTASSSATMPLTMECLIRRAKVSPRVTSFTIPLGATVNMDGTALYECVAAMFIAQAYGFELSFSQQFIVVLLAILTSIGVAGIPAASLVAITLVLTTVGVPLEGIGLILALDRVLDMARTSVNVLGDSAAAVVVARGEGELVLTDDPAPAPAAAA